MDPTADPARRLQGSPYTDDDGSADPGLAAALTEYDAADRPAAGSRAHDEVLRALSSARLLVPVVAVLGEAEQGPDGLTRDKSSDMATVLLTGADGRLALLAFTSGTTLAGWRADARPVPAATRLAAATARQEGAAALVLDLAGPVTFVVEGDDLTALAAGWTLAEVAGRSAWIGPAGESSDTLPR